MLKILDRSYKCVGLLRSKGDLSKIIPYFDDEYTQELTTGAETFKFSTLGNSDQANYLKIGNYISFRDRTGVDRLFVIMEVQDTHDDTFIKEVYCEMAGIELNNEVIRPVKILSANINKFLATILLETDWEVGEIEDGLTSVYDFEITDYTTVYSALQEYVINKYGYEISYRIVYDKNKVKHKYIDVYKEKGRKLQNIFRYSKDLVSVVRKVDSSELVTALIGVGNNNLTFKEVHADDKPLDQDFIVNEDSYARWNVNGSHIMGVFNYNTDSSQELLKKTREELIRRSEPKVEYELKLDMINKDIQLGDTIGIVDQVFTPSLQLTGRVNKLITSVTNPENDSCVLANFKEISNNTINDLILDELIRFLDVGKLTLAEIEYIKSYLARLGIEKDTIDDLFNKLMNKDEEDPNKNPSENPSDNPSSDSNNIGTLEGGLWFGDSRMVSMKNYDLLKVENQSTIVDRTEYIEALALYNSLGTGSKTSTTSYKNLVSSSNKYKIPTIVRYWSQKIGVDPNLVFMNIMAESSGDPYCATGSAGGYGLMQCYRGVFFQGFSGSSAQTIKFVDGTTKSFYPSYSNMTPYEGGNTTLNGITVDKNISNQIMFGVWELKQSIEYARGNIFAGLMAYNMGVGAMYWIVSKYVCDTYGYTFVNKNSINAQCKEARNKAYEVLEAGKFEFANWREKYINNGGSGVVNNVELYLRWYKIENGQLPYTVDSNGNKIGYGASTAVNNSKAVATVVNNSSLTNTRTLIIDKAKEIVQLHRDGLASYSQYPRTIDDTKRKYIKKGTYVKLGSNKWGYAGSTYNGISTSVNDGKGVIGYDCSSFASCCYMNAGLRSLYNGNCSGGTIMNEIINNGGMMWLANSEGRKKAKAGDCIMFCSGNHVPTQKEMDNKKFLNTHHIGVYLGDDQMAHASKWTTMPNAIKISKLSTYSTLSTAFFIRPKDLIEADESESVVETPSTEINNNITAKCVIGASAYHFYSDNKLLQTVQVGKYSDTTKYPSDVQYIYVHLGVNDPYLSGYSSIKTLLSLLQSKYPNKQIFVAKELRVGSSYSNYAEFNAAIDTFNNQVADYCAEYKNVHQIDISNNLEEDGVLKSSVTSDGVHLNSKGNYEILFNNIKDKIVGEIGNTEKPETTQKVNVEKVLKSTQNYYYDTINSLYFKLPSKVENSYYSRLKFTTSEDFTYTQSKICYLEGTDCIAGQLVPKPNTTYKIIIMANVNEDIDYKYYGSVTVLNAGSYTDFADFVGGKKVVEIAKTYLNRDNLEYMGWKSTVNQSPASFTNPAANLDKWYDSARGKDQIDCSTFSKFCYMGLDYDKTPYADHTMTSIKRNSKYSWTFTFPRNAALQAEYCVKNGWVLHGADMVNYSNLEQGDLIFWDRDSQDNGRYMNCSHVAICYGLVDGEMNSIEVTTKEGTVIVRPIKENKEDKILFVARPKKH